MRKIFGIFFVIICPALWGMSPERHPEKDYTHYLPDPRSGATKSQVLTALSSAVSYPDANLRSVKRWPDYASVETYFRYVRDKRFIDWKGQSRRIFWLYPRNGCYSRAALTVKLLKDPQVPVHAPEKIFVFGNLAVVTPNSSTGKVYWWYHVAPVVQVGRKKFVLDPAIDSTGPLPLDVWLARMGDPKEFKVSICGTGTYVPSSDCARVTDGKELRALSVAGTFLDHEQELLNSLGRNSELELGDRPPWRQSILNISQWNQSLPEKQP